VIQRVERDKEIMNNVTYVQFCARGSEFQFQFDDSADSVLSMRCHFVVDAREDVHCVVDTAVRPLEDVQVTAGICLEFLKFYVFTLHVEITSAGVYFVFFQNTIFFIEACVSQ
jgi:hypothetical protein